MKRHDEKLQKYFDQELSPRQARAFQEQLQASEDEQKRLAALGEMRAAIKATVEEGAAEGELDYLWTRVQAQIAQAPRPSLFMRFYWLMHRFRALAATGTAVGLLVLFISWPGPKSGLRQEALIESLEMDPDTFSTIFTIDAPEADLKTSVIWIDENPQLQDEQDTDVEEGDIL